MSRVRVVGAVTAVLVVTGAAVLMVNWVRGGLPDRVWELQEACTGTAFDDALEFEGGGPHPIVVFMSDDETGDLEYTRVSTAEGDPPPDPWEPNDAQQVQLVACATLVEEQPSTIECDYGDTPGSSASAMVPMKRAIYLVRINELRTNRQVRSLTVHGSDTDCPPAVNLDDVPERFLSRIPVEQWQQEAGDLVTGSR